MAKEPTTGAAAAPTGAPDVLLMSMPFGPISQPSIGLSLLKAGLERAGVRAEILYANVLFAQRFGPEVFNWPHRVWGQLQLGEWIFSNALFPRSDPEREAYFDLLRRDAPEHFGEDSDDRGVFAHTAVLGLVAEIERFLLESAAAVVARSPRIVGFTCLAQQLVASLALAQRLRELRPGICTVFGGPSCEGVKGLEIVRRFPFVSAVVSGEGDVAFPILVGRILRGESAAGIPGVYLAGDPPPEEAGCGPPRAPAVTRLDDLPVPEYDDFFEQLEASGLTSWADPSILFETARGCWWGQKHHCRYCSLNLREMAFRSKSPDRILAELRQLAARYPGRHLQAVDNMLDLKYFLKVIPELASRPLGTTLFFEVPCRLKKWQVRLLRDAGVTRMQPGIESLSTAVLRLMNRPATQLSNVQLLKWCREFGIVAVWNLLVGIPREAPAEYARGAELVPKLTHLFPPVYFGPISLSRHSPYFEEPEAYGLRDVAAYDAYRHIFPFEEASLERLAHYFSYRYAAPQDVAAYVAPMAAAWEEWRRMHLSSDLFFIDRDTDLAFLDLRPIARTPFRRLAGLERALYLACDEACSLDRLQAIAGETMRQPVTRGEVVECLEPLVEEALVLRDEDRYLALALPVGEYEPRLHDRWRLEIYLAAETGAAPERGIAAADPPGTDDPAEASARATSAARVAPPR